jgi:hypothetical protein
MRFSLALVAVLCLAGLAEARLFRRAAPAQAGGCGQSQAVAAGACGQAAQAGDCGQSAYSAGTGPAFDRPRARGRLLGRLAGMRR